MFKMFRNWFRYLTGSAQMKANQLKDPTVELELELDRLKSKARELRESGAKVIASRTTLTGRYNAAVTAAAEAKARAISALERASTAEAKGDAQELTKWTSAATRYNAERTSKEAVANGLELQIEAMNERVDLIKEQTAANEEAVARLADEKHVILAKLEQAKAQEMVNETMESMNRESGIFDDANFAKVTEKVDARLALANAKAELESGSMAATTRELEKGMKAEDDAVALDSLRAELLGTGEVAQITGAEETTKVTDRV